MESKYNPQKVEANKYHFWREGGFFRPKRPKAKSYSIMIPPPNVTGILHIGHAYDTAIQDAIIRRKRMQGFDALYLAGSDHAGVATQAKLDEKLKGRGESRYALGRDKFMEFAWSWVSEYQQKIHDQWGVIGLSLDYDNESFTLDKGFSAAVAKVFIDLYNKGLIYRGLRIINWDSEAKTALSNIEVEYQEIKGKLYYIKYPFTDGSGYLVVATTRPETMYGDRAVMISPKDERYQMHIGKHVFIPGTDVSIPVICDEYVDSSFGSGCVKVTPGHDPNDFEVGIRHNLEMPLCIEEDGKMNSLAYEFCGLDRFACRRKLLKKLEELDLIEKTMEHIHMVGHSERTGVVVEPRLSLQWFVKMEEIAKKTLEESKVEFVPPRFENNFLRWMENANDWCISRQIWWGHQIPAWHKDGEVKVQIECPGDGWIADPDVLDTWFSSALWPFATLGWPEDTEMLKRFYPNNAIVMGYDIIFFWCARMIFQSLLFTNESPFEKAIIHGLVRDKDGKKMSKSAGNGVDPMAIAQEYGADAMRYFLVTASALGTDIRFDLEKIKAAWNYINKVWNIARFISMNLTDDFSPIYDIASLKLNDASIWILNRFNQTIASVDYHFEQFEFNEAAKAIYNFMWDDFASNYVEMAKIDLKNDSNGLSVLHFILMQGIKMLHPFIPFVTEEIYQLLPHTEESIMIAKWPSKCKIREESSIDLVVNIVKSIRNIRAETQNPLSKPLTMAFDFPVSQEAANYIFELTNVTLIEYEAMKQIDSTTVFVMSFGNIMMEKKHLFDYEDEIRNLENASKKLLVELKRSENLLANESFISKASPQKVDIEKQKYLDYKNQYDETVKRLKAIKEDSA